MKFLPGRHGATWPEYQRCIAAPRSLYGVASRQKRQLHLSKASAALTVSGLLLRAVMSPERQQMWPGDANVMMLLSL